MIDLSLIHIGYENVSRQTGRFVSDFCMNWAILRFEIMNWAVLAEVGKQDDKSHASDLHVCELVYAVMLQHANQTTQFVK